MTLTLMRLAIGWCLCALLGCSELVSVAREPDAAPTTDLARVDLSLPADVAIDLAPPADLGSPTMDAGPSPTDVGLPPADVAPRTDRGAPADVAPDATRPTGVVAMRLDVSDLSPEGVRGATELFEDGQVWVASCQIMTGCERRLRRMRDGAAAVLALRAAMEDAGLLSLSEDVYRGATPSSDFTTLVYQRAGATFMWSTDDLTSAPPVLMRAVSLVRDAIAGSVAAE